MAAMAAARAAAAPGIDWARRDPPPWGGSQNPEGARRPGRRELCPNEAAHFAPRGGAPASAPGGADALPDDIASHGGGLTLNGAPSSAAGGPGGDNPPYDPASEVQIITTAIGNQEK